MSWSNNIPNLNATDNWHSLHKQQQQLKEIFDNKERESKEERCGKAYDRHNRWSTLIYSKKLNANKNQEKEKTLNGMKQMTQISLLPKFSIIDLFIWYRI